MPNKNRSKNISIHNNSAIIPNTCDNCNQPVGKKEKKVMCNTCLKQFHIECVRITRLQFLKLQDNVWFCSPTCKKKSSIPLNTNIVDDNNESLEDDESDDANDDGTLLSNQQSMMDVVKSQQFISNQLEELLKENKEIKKILMNYKHLETRVKQLEIEIEVLKQQKNDDLMILAGIPESQNEDLKTITMAIARTLKVNLDGSDIIELSRLKSKNVNYTTKHKYPPPVIVKFVHPSFKARLMSAKKNLGPLYTQQLFTDNTNEKDVINFRSFLTSYFMELLNKAKQLVGYKYIWYSGYKIQLRKDDTTPVISICSKDEIDTLFKAK